MEGIRTNIFKRVKKEQEQLNEFIVRVNSEQDSILIHNALTLAANNTIEQMIKCKDVIQMSNLSVKREKQNSLGFIAHVNKNRDIRIELSDIDIIREALKEYKEKTAMDIKKSNHTSEEFDGLCEEIYICNKLLKQFKEDDKVENIVEE